MDANNYLTDVSSSAPGYKIDGDVVRTKSGLEFPLSFMGDNEEGRDLYGKTIDDLTVSVDFEAEDRLRVLIADKEGKQIPVPDSPLGLERSKHDRAARKRNYDFKYTENPFGFQVIRKADKSVIFDTTDYPLVFEDQYLEISTAVPKETNLYGVGEVVTNFRRDNKQVCMCMLALSCFITKIFLH